MTTSTTQVLHVPDWPDRAEDRLLRAWDKPRIRALLLALGTGIQAQEEMAWDVLVSTQLESATGVSLDQWGAIVGEQRGPLSDSEYRRFIMVRMLVNRCNGSVDSLIEILDLATQPNSEVLHLDNFPAGLYLQVTRKTWMTAPMLRRVGRLMEDVRPAGRHMTCIETVEGGFGFEGSDYSAGYNEGPFARLIIPG